MSWFGAEVNGPLVLMRAVHFAASKASWHSLTRSARRKNLAAGIDVGGMVIHCNVWLDAVLMDQPAEPGRADRVRTVRANAQSCAWRYLRLPDCRGRLDIDDDCVVDVDQVVRGVREDGLAAVHSGQRVTQTSG